MERRSVGMKKKKKERKKERRMRFLDRFGINILR